jgi:hypothetical protein
VSQSVIRLAKPRVPVFLAIGRIAGQYPLTAVVALYECGRIAAMRKRKDGAITHVYLRASSGEIGPRSHRTATVVHDLPMTWSPNRRYYAHPKGMHAARV